MANTTGGKVFIAGAGTDSKANEKLYDDWAAQYEKDVRSWGYTMPEDCAKILKKYTPVGKESTFKILDAGAGDGISGKAITDLGYKDVTGTDLSPELIKIAQTNGIYKAAFVEDLSKPMSFKNDEFDAITVVGVMTYLGPDGCALDEFCRVVKPGGLVIFTHRTDKVDKWKSRQEQFVKEGKWETVEITEPLPYLPKNPEYADKIKVIIHVFRVCSPRSKL
jgi:predicted TPR repeat methyltransferase